MKERISFRQWLSNNHYPQIEDIREYALSGPDNPATINRLYADYEHHIDQYYQYCDEHNIIPLFAV